MTNRVITFLEDIGKDFQNGLAKLIPIVAKGVTIAQEVAPYISAIDPAFGAVFQTSVAAISTIEQKFAAMNQQTGTGTQKLANALQILTPVVSQAFAAAGKPSDTATVTNYINAVVGLLNAIPASTTPAPAVSA
jgi:hypothetical protein